MFYVFTFLFGFAQFGLSKELKQFAVKHVNGRMYGIKMRSQGRRSVSVIGLDA